jgi:hypothetical protein
MAEITVLITVQHGSTRIEHVLKSGRMDQAGIASEIERTATECGSEAAAIAAGAFGGRTS